MRLERIIEVAQTKLDQKEKYALFKLNRRIHRKSWNLRLRCRNKTLRQFTVFRSYQMHL